MVETVRFTGFSPAEVSSRKLPAVISQHAEEAGFQWLLRDAAVYAPHYALKDLIKLDGRVEAHVDGLRVAGDDGWHVCKEHFKWRDAGEVFAAAVVALDSQHDVHIREVVGIGCSAPELQRGLISAIGWSSSPLVPKLLAQLVASVEPAARRVAIAGRAIRREDLGQHLARGLNDDDLRVRARTLKASAELGKVDSLSSVRQSLSHEDPACRFWAAWSAARLGDRSTTKRILEALALQPGPFQEKAVAMAVRTRDLHDATQLLRQLWQTAAMLRPAAVGIGALGDPQLLPVLLQLMSINEVSRVAGEAFSKITGVDLAYSDLDQERPEDFQTGPTEHTAGEDVAMDPDENLPWPNPELIAKWWNANTQRFTPGTRYLCGREISDASLVETLYDGFQRQRAAAALELGLLHPQRPLFEVRARGDWQQRLLPVWYPMP